MNSKLCIFYLFLFGNESRCKLFPLLNDFLRILPLGTLGTEELTGDGGNTNIWGLGLEPCPPVPRENCLSNLTGLAVKSNSQLINLARGLSILYSFRFGPEEVRKMATWTWFSKFFFQFCQVHASQKEKNLVRNSKGPSVLGGIG